MLSAPSHPAFVRAPLELSTQSSLGWFWCPVLTQNSLELILLDSSSWTGSISCPGWNVGQSNPSSSSAPLGNTSQPQVGLRPAAFPDFHIKCAKFRSVFSFFCTRGCSPCPELSDLPRLFSSPRSACPTPSIPGNL